MIARKRTLYVALLLTHGVVIGWTSNMTSCVQLHRVVAVMMMGAMDIKESLTAHFAQHAIQPVLFPVPLHGFLGVIYVVYEGLKIVLVKNVVTNWES